MFLLFFPPAATGWLSTDTDLEIDDQPTRRPSGKWVHITARTTVAATSPAPSKEIGDASRLAGVTETLRRDERRRYRFDSGASHLHESNPHQAEPIPTRS